MKKRGVSHIEVILAFVIFVAAVGFGLYFFNTGDSTRVVDATLTYALRELEQNTSTPIEVFLVNVSGSLITNPLAINFSGVGGNVSVETYDGRMLSSSRSGMGGEIVYVSSPNWGRENIIYVLFGEEFQDDGIAPSSQLNYSYYKIGSSETRELVSEKKFKKLGEAYRTDYKGLKNRDNFNLPERADFGFSLIFDDGNSIVFENKIPDNFEVFSETKRVEVLREDGSRIFANLIVKVW